MDTHSYTYKESNLRKNKKQKKKKKKKNKKKQQKKNKKQKNKLLQCVKHVDQEIRNSINS